MRMEGVFLLVVFLFCLMCSSTSMALFGQSYCKQAGYKCVKVKRGQSWSKLFPDAQDRDIVMRLNRLNIRLYSGMKIAVPDNLSARDIMEFAPFPRQIQPRNEKLVVFDPRQQAWAAFDSAGMLVRWGPASGGSDWCRDISEPCHTRSGEFRIFSMGSSECISHKFPLPDGGAPMPYCMYFNNGQAFHGEPNGLPGYNASHGCVRLYVNDAEWLRYDFVEPASDDNNFQGTKVIIGSYYNDGYDDEYSDE